VTNSRAIDVLFNTWLGFTVILSLTVVIQSLAGKYGGDWAIPLQWAFAVVAPA
jgi:hypothetical protein